DVDGVVAEVFDHASGFGHDLRISAEELSSDGVFVFLVEKIASGLGGAAGNAFRTGELGHKQATTALSPNDAAKKRVGYASHGSKNGGWADGKRAHAVFGGESRGGCGIGRWWAFTPSEDGLRPLGEVGVVAVDGCVLLERF